MRYHLAISLLAILFIGCATSTPIQDYREAVQAMNSRAKSVAGVELFSDVRSADDGSAEVLVTDVWNQMPEAGRESYANALFDRWQSHARGQEPLRVTILDPSGKIVGARPK